MTTKVVKRKSRARQKFEGFSFTGEMIPDSNGSRVLADYRAQAWKAFEQLPYPTTKDEPWRRTDLRGLKNNFRIPNDGDANDLPAIPDYLLQPLTDDHPGGQITLLPDGMKKSLDADLADQGVIFTDLATASQTYPDQVSQALGQVVKVSEGKFAALAGALTENGVFVYVPRGVQVERPLHSVLWGAGQELAYFSHLIIWLEDGASLTYVHETASPDGVGGQTLHNGIVEIHVGKNANLRFVELQSLGDNVWNFTHERARVEKDGHLDWIFGAIGTQLTKNFTDLDLVGSGAYGRVSGFYFTDGKQHLDHDTQQNHMADHTTSDLLFKGALSEDSRSVWQGMIFVDPKAQQTDGFQANRNLVLSNDARADAIPGLEILADDVRCTHAATIGKIDPELIFYLRSRGISKKEAERIIVEGFFDPIMARIPFEGVRTRFQDAITKKMAAR
ncbi:MAG: Fe-S cluster assembly protein SufD [Chloroflexota bacterium]